MTDVVIIGAGPAGSSAAIHLAHRGAWVQLYEKAHFPRRKLCGGFISQDGVRELRRLGVWLDGAWPVWEFEASAPSGRRVSTHLPFEGFSISRYSLDATLLKAAREAGVEVHEDEEMDPSTVPSSWTIVSSGRKPRMGHALYGFQASFDHIPDIRHQVALDFVPGGYIGWVQQEGRVNLCGLIDQQTMRAKGPVLQSLLEYLSSCNPILKARLANAKRATPWLATGPVVMGRRTLADETRLFAGDAACVVDPFIGEGISAALRMGRLAAEALTQTEMAPQRHYEAAWEKAFSVSLRTQTVLRQALRFRVGQEALISLMRLLPSTLSHLALTTRAA